MDYDSIDWDAEAKRVARAFEVVNECQFVDVPQFAGGVRKSLLRPRASFLKRLFNPRLRHCKREPFTRNGLLLSISYRPANGTVDCVFTLTDNRTRPRLDRDMVAVSFSHNGAVVTDALVRDDHKYSDVLAKGLFHLGMLMPEIEAALQISVSAHEKLEWAREHEERLECEAIDWDAEAVRVARAFGLEVECKFVEAQKRGDTRDKRLYKSVRGVFNQWPHSAQEREIRVIYHSAGNEIGIYCKPENGQYPDYMTLRFHPDGSLLFHPNLEPAVVEELARALFHLGLLSPDTEAALNLSISSHQKLEWTMEFESPHENRNF